MNGETEVGALSMVAAPKGSVLVTGGAGYIGSHACKALAEAGWLPVTYDNLSKGHPEMVQWGPLESGDVCDANRLAQVISRYRPVAVMHFAALAEVGESMSRPEHYYRNNVLGTVTLLEAMVKGGVAFAVFSSTCAIYGTPETVPITEQERYAPVSPYGASKMMAERVFEDMGRAHGLRHVALRYFNAAGADEGGCIGEQHNPETHLIPLVLKTVLGERQGLDIYGTDYPTPDGTAVRDYIHVTDLASAHVAALDHLLNGGDSVALNLGTGRGYSVREVIATVERVTNQAVSTREVGRREGDPPELVADPKKAMSVLGWQPKASDLTHIVASAWKWVNP